MLSRTRCSLRTPSAWRNEIDAPSEGEASELAKQRFCKAERLCEWSLHADRIQVKAN